MKMSDYKDQAQAILDKMTVREKANFCVGKDFWYLMGNANYDLPEVMVTDGPHGLRKQSGETDTASISGSVPATAFPTASATAASFDPNLLYEMGQCLGDECVKEKVAVLLGPAVNHKRSPLCGRNFEYVSEDPYLTGKIASGLVNGIQSTGVGTSVKHFACNSQETARMGNNSIVDERTLQEIYLRQYETIVKESQPTTIMDSYNRINGTFSSDSKYLMQEQAREKWGYKGLFVTDWGAMNDPVEGYINGLDLEMPGGSTDRIDRVEKAVESGRVSKERLDEAAGLVIELILRYKDCQAAGTKCDMDHNAEVARKVSSQSMILLKNDDSVLPLKKGAKVGVFGAMAKHPRYQGAGSSKTNPYKLDCPLDAFKDAGIDVTYSEGYGDGELTIDENKVIAAEQAAKQCDVAVIFAGLPDMMESEGFDRNNMDMPESHNELIRRIAAVNDNVIVVLQLGSPVTMPWIDDVKGVVLAYLSGCQGGHAAVDVLSGAVNPSGHLAETFPLALSDTPCYLNYKNDKYNTKYKESIFTGYRYYDTAGQKVLFPFGYGLSYTTFRYSNLRLGAAEISDKDTLKVYVDVTNTGDVKGKDVVQLYVSQKNPTIYKAKKELKGFDKVELNPGETKTVSFSLDSTAFDFFNVNIHDYCVESGEYVISIAKDVTNVALTASVQVKSTTDAAVPDYHETAPSYYHVTRHGLNIPDNEFAAVYGGNVNPGHQNKPYTRNTTVGELMETKVGSKFRPLLGPMLKKSALGGDPEVFAMMEAMMMDFPIRGLRLMAGDKVTSDIIDGIVELLNKHPIEAVKDFRKKKTDSKKK